MKKPDPNELTAWAAANNLHLKIPGKSPDYWHWFLTNRRRSDRAGSDTIRFKREGRAVIYHMNELAQFAEKERDRRKQLDSRSNANRGRGSGSGADFRWAVTGRNSPEKAGGVLHFEVKGFALRLSLSPKQAREMAAELLRHAERIEPSTSGGR